MKLALLADIHSNLEALSACLAQARRLGADRLAFLGDIVGYNADPLACLDIVRREVERGAIAVRGNHDESALEGLLENMNLPARDAIYWTRERLDGDARAWLAGLPLVAQAGEATLVHASPEAPGRWLYVTSEAAAQRALGAAPTRLVFCGHVHHTVYYYSAGDEAVRRFVPVAGVPVPLLAWRRWLCIVGSVGQPRDGASAAAWALYDDEAGALTSYRVPYDRDAAMRKLRAAGLPERLALRLETGH